MQTFSEVGKVVYKRPFSPKSPANVILQMTVMQLIGSKIIELVISDDKPAVVFSLSVQLSTSLPNYLYDVFWVGIPLVD